MDPPTLHTAPGEACLHPQSAHRIDQFRAATGDRRSCGVRQELFGQDTVECYGHLASPCCRGFSAVDGGITHRRWFRQPDDPGVRAQV